MIDTGAITKTHQQFIEGAWVDSSDGATIPVVNPADDTVIANVQGSGIDDVNRAVDAADRAFQTWQRTRPKERSEMLLKLADRIESRRDEIARLESRNVGKPLRDAMDEVPFVVDNLRFFAGAGRSLEGKAVNEYAENFTSLIRREPVGVVAAITPWNYPILLACWKIGPALMAGNTVVLKPSTRTPLTTLYLAELAADIFPPGVLNVMTGNGDTIGDHIVAHPKVGMISVTGDTETGKRIARTAAAKVKRLHLELGGKSPVVVFDDVDLAYVVQNLKEEGYRNTGQVCTAASRVLAGPRIYDRLVADLAAAATQIRWGDPTEGDFIEMGPLSAKAQADKVDGMVERARSGAEIVTGGKRPSRPGAYYEPTVIAGPDQRSEIVQEEAFGPVVSVQRFETEDHAIAWANDVRFGLAASVFTSDIGRALRVSKLLQFGTVWVNHHGGVASEMPHGGFKESGYGHDMSTYAIEDYTVTKHVMVKI